jgi:hypothetical protein
VGKRGPPGKFYIQQAAMALLDTLRTGGSSGKVVTAPNSTDDQRAHFDRFCSRLNAGELVRVSSCFYRCLSNSSTCSS